MAKFYGAIGFATSSETSEGVWTDTIIDVMYKGDVIRVSRKDEMQDNSLNPNLTINNRISIIADAFASENLFAMRYVSWYGAKWKITNVEVQRPRMILTIGGVYNGNEA